MLLYPLFIYFNGGFMILFHVFVLAVISFIVYMITKSELITAGAALFVIVSVLFSG